MKDDGWGMSPETLKKVSDPFYTTRTTRKAGLGIPLLTDAAQMAGGEVRIESEPGAGTTTTATFQIDNIDRKPLGDVADTMTVSIMGHPELAELRKKSLDAINMRDGHSQKRIIVGMATCGIAAGARPVMNAFSEELKKRNISDVTVGMTGCMGMCVLEPMVDVYDENGGKVTYVKMNPEKVARVVAEHIVNGQPVTEYTVASENL